MGTIYTKTFQKAYNKLQRKDRGKVKRAIEIFKENPDAPELKNHALWGNYKGEWAFSASFDLRIIYKKEGDYAVVYFLRLGSHNQVY